MKYTLTITNKATSEVDFTNPVLIDVLPTGVTFYNESGYEPVVSSGTQGEILELVGVKPMESNQSSSGDGSDSEYCVVFRLSGSLKPGSSVTLDFYTMINPGAIANDHETQATRVRNDVYLSSTTHTYHTTDNPNGYSFAVSQSGGSYNFGASLEDAAGRSRVHSHHHCR